MIVLITGLPGAGKSLYALNWVKAKADREGRAVYYSGIADLNLPWTEIDPQKWMDAPANSIVVIDECQRVFRPRMHGTSVPAYVAELETHRHKGIDIVLITQHPMLLESNARRLCGLHFHVVRKFGLNASTVHEWASVKENCDKNRDGSTRHDFKYPKASFAWYKSAEVHTHKARIPFRVFVLAAVLLGLCLLGWFLYNRWHERMTREVPASSAAASSPSQMPGGAIAPPVPGQAEKGGTPELTREEWLKRQLPRIEGLAYTAPAYDTVTQPVRAPYPAACVQSKSMGCRCYSQQGTRLAVPTQLCKSISEGGFFMAWQEAPQGSYVPPEQGAREQQVMPVSSAPPSSSLEAVPLSPKHKARNPVRPDEPRGMATLGANVAQAGSADGEMLAWMRGR